MKSFAKTLAGKEILILSDYVPLDQYTHQEIIQEKKLISSIKYGIKKYSLSCHYLEVKNLSHLKAELSIYPPDRTLVFNWCEDFHQQPGSAILVARFLEKQGYVFTGGGSRSLSLNTNKFKTSQILQKNHLSVPKHLLIKNMSDLKKCTFFYPAIIKLANQHSSVGLSSKNVVQSYAQLTSVITDMFRCFPGPLIVEEYITGQEYTVPVWGNPPYHSVMPVSQIIFTHPNKVAILTEASKFNSSSSDFLCVQSHLLNCDQQKKLLDQISTPVLSAYQLLGLRDYARFELRLNTAGAFIIDSNVNPALDLNNSLFQAAQSLGYNSAEFILQVATFALLRNQSIT